MDVRVDGVRTEGNDEHDSVNIPAASAMSPPPHVPKDRGPMPVPASSTMPDATDPVPSNPNADSGLEWRRRGDLCRVKLSDIEANEGLPSSTYLRSVETLALSLRNHGAAVLEPSQQDQLLLQCALQTTRLFLRNTSGGAAWAGGVRKASGGVVQQRSRSGDCACPLLDSCTFRAGDLDPECGYEPQSPPCADKAFSCLGKVSRTALAALERSLLLANEHGGSLLSTIDPCPLLIGETSSSFLTISAHLGPSSRATTPSPHLEPASDSVSVPPASEMLGKDLEGIKCEEESGSGLTEETPESLAPAESAKIVASLKGGAQEQVAPGLLAVVASDMPGLEVKDSNGNWIPVDKGVPPGCLVVLSGKALQQASKGLCRASTFRFADVLPCATPPTLLTPGSTARAGVIASDSRQILPRHGCTHPITRCTVAFHCNQREGSVGEIGVPALPGRGPSRHGSSSGIMATLKDLVSGDLIEDAVIAPCGHSFGKASLERVLSTMLCINCKEPVSPGDLVPNLIARAVVAALKAECRTHAGTGSVLKPPGPSLRRKHTKKTGFPSAPAQAQKPAEDRPQAQPGEPASAGPAELSASLGGSAAEPQDCRDSKESPNATAASGDPESEAMDLIPFEAKESLDRCGDEDDDEETLPSGGDDWPSSSGQRYGDTQGLGSQVLEGSTSGPPTLPWSTGISGLGGLKAAKRKKEKENSGPGLGLGGTGLPEEGRGSEAGGSGAPWRVPAKKGLPGNRPKPGRMSVVDGLLSPDRDKERDRERAEGSTRLRGVQFPFAVNDRVLIKGNKRTPEKFVGREAIITSQCLNGWYKVRTLDTGDSVRLQYRSLQRSGPGGRSAGDGNTRVQETASDMMQLTLLPPPSSGDNHAVEGHPPTASPPFCTGQQLATRALSPLSIPLRNPLEGVVAPTPLSGQSKAKHRREKDKTGSAADAPSGQRTPGEFGREWLCPPGDEDAPSVRWAQEALPASDREGDQDDPGAEGSTPTGLRMFMDTQRTWVDREDGEPGGDDVCVDAGQYSTSGLSRGPGGGGSLVELSLAVAAVTEGYAADEPRLSPLHDLGGSREGMEGPQGSENQWERCVPRKKSKSSHAVGLSLLTLSLEHGELGEDGRDADLSVREEEEDARGEERFGGAHWPGLHHDEQQENNLSDRVHGKGHGETPGRGDPGGFGELPQMPDPPGLLRLGSQGSARMGPEGDDGRSLLGSAGEPRHMKVKNKPRASRKEGKVETGPSGKGVPSPALSVKLKLPGKLTKIKQTAPAAQRVHASTVPFVDRCDASQGGEPLAEASGLPLAASFTMMPLKKRDFLMGKSGLASSPPRPDSFAAPSALLHDHKREGGGAQVLDELIVEQGHAVLGADLAEPWTHRGSILTGEWGRSSREYGASGPSLHSPDTGAGTRAPSGGDAFPLPPGCPDETKPGAGLEERVSSAVQGEGGAAGCSEQMQAASAAPEHGRTPQGSSLVTSST